MTADLDTFLARSMRQFVRGEALPSWPGALEMDPDKATDRILFHGIALQLLNGDPDLTDWPAAIAKRITEQARLQAFWEIMHREVLAQVFEALHAAGASGVLLKGSALAYTLYDDPAMRRRSDSDMLVDPAAKAKARAVLCDLGFERDTGATMLQEAWFKPTSYGFTHQIDLHWGWKSSPQVDACLRAVLPIQPPLRLNAISPHARGTGHLDNLLLIAVNRASHEIFGYASNHQNLFEKNRLIWAIDLHLIAAAISEDEWERLPELAVRAGCASLVLDTLRFVENTLGTAIPESALAQLARVAATADDPVTVYYRLADDHTLERALRDLSACNTLKSRLATAHYYIFPSASVLHERYPQARHWPLSALRLRRLVSQGGRILRDRVLT